MVSRPSKIVFCCGVDGHLHSWLGASSRRLSTFIAGAWCGCRRSCGEKQVVLGSHFARALRSWPRR